MYFSSPLFRYVFYKNIFTWRDRKSLHIHLHHILIQSELKYHIVSLDQLNWVVFDFMI